MKTKLRSIIIVYSVRKSLHIEYYFNLICPTPLENRNTKLREQNRHSKLVPKCFLLCKINHSKTHNYLPKNVSIASYKQTFANFPKGKISHLIWLVKSSLMFKIKQPGYVPICLGYFRLYSVWKAMHHIYFNMPAIINQRMSVMGPLLTKRPWTVCLFAFVCLFVSSSAASKAREHFKYQVQEIFGANNSQRLAAGGSTTCSCLTPEKNNCLFRVPSCEL